MSEANKMFQVFYLRILIESGRNVITVQVNKIPKIQSKFNNNQIVILLNIHPTTFGHFSYSFWSITPFVKVLRVTLIFTHSVLLYGHSLL